MPSANSYAAPPEPKIYHILNIDNLPSLIEQGCLLSDDQMKKRNIKFTPIGMSEIKRRRLQLPVTCHHGLMVGACVPFYFCPRSIMLYLLHRSNAPGLAYMGGQRLIIHLEADLGEVVQWAENVGGLWAFTTSNAGAYYAEFYNDMTNLNLVNWPAVNAKDFTDPQVKEGKQAEFLLQDAFPWCLIRTIGVIDNKVADQVKKILPQRGDLPLVRVKPEWYY